MLFDLKGRRKRLVQVVYLVLAILFGGGLVLFGVGSDVQGGLFDAFKGNSNTNLETFENTVERAKRATRANPENEKAWLALARAEYLLAQASDDFNSEVGQFEEGAVNRLNLAVTAWERYLALKPKNPDPAAGALMVQAYAALVTYGAGGSPLDLFRDAARTQRLIAVERPSPQAWYQLGIIYYAIGEIGKGDKAGQKALQLTPADQRNTVRAQLKDVRKQGVKARKEVKEAREQAAKAAREARKSGQDPFGAPPGQTQLAPSPGAPQP